jgi:flagellum-specific peptidoglycan hydrolase FlgJ
MNKEFMKLMQDKVAEDMKNAGCSTEKEYQQYLINMAKTINWDEVDDEDEDLL